MRAAGLRHRKSYYRGRNCTKSYRHCAHFEHDLQCAEARDGLYVLSACEWAPLLLLTQKDGCQSTQRVQMSVLR